MEIVKNKFETNIAEENLVTIDSVDSALVISYLTSGLYSDPIGAVVREYTSNCLDAIKYAGKSEGVTIHLEKVSVIDGPNSYLHFIDTGCGLSQQSLIDIYLKIGASDKRNTNDLIGGYGLGGKSFAAYCDSITVESNYEGIKNTVYIYKNDLGSLSYLFLTSNEVTEDKNGTTVSVPINSTDINKIETSIINQLLYIDSIEYKGFDEDFYNKLDKCKKSLKITDEVSIFPTTGYGNQSRLNLRLLIGGISYSYSYYHTSPISNKIGFIVTLPIGKYKFTPSRENLVESDELKNNIQELVDNCISEINEQISQKIILLANNFYERFNALYFLERTHDYSELKLDILEPLFILDDIKLEVIKDTVLTYSQIKSHIQNSFYYDSTNIKTNLNKKSNYVYFNYFLKNIYLGQFNYYKYKSKLPLGTELTGYFRTLQQLEQVFNIVKEYTLEEYKELFDNDLVSEEFYKIYSDFMNKLEYIEDLDWTEPVKITRTKKPKVEKLDKTFNGREFNSLESGFQLKKTYSLDDLEKNEKYVIIDDNDSFTFLAKNYSLFRYALRDSEISIARVLCENYYLESFNQLFLIIKPYKKEIERIDLSGYKNICFVSKFTISNSPLLSYLIENEKYKLDNIKKLCKEVDSVLGKINSNNKLIDLVIEVTDNLKSDIDKLKLISSNSYYAKTLSKTYLDKLQSIIENELSTSEFITKTDLFIQETINLITKVETYYNYLKPQCEDISINDVMASYIKTNLKKYE